MKETKITALDPRGQPSGIFGRNLNPEDDMMAITDPAVQPTVSLKELEHLHMAPRLTSLENKRVMLIDSGFAGSRDFMEEVQAWFKKNMPSVKTEVARQAGQHLCGRAGILAGRKKRCRCRNHRRRRLRRLFGESRRIYADAGDMTYDIPTAPIVTSRFADYIQRDGRTHGMNLRWSFPPYPVGWVLPGNLTRLYSGNDPISGAPIMDEIIFALTQPLTDAEKNIRRCLRGRSMSGCSKRIRKTNLQRLFLESGWTDGLPIILPTEERVAEMLTGTDHGPHEVSRDDVRHHASRNALNTTVEKVAACNAVMAGARPEHFPVILAHRRLRTDHRCLHPPTSFGSMVVVNGPIRNEIGHELRAGGALSPSITPTRSSAGPGR